MVTRRDFFKITAAGSLMASMGHIAEAKGKMYQYLSDTGYLTEGERKIPVHTEADLVVVGGSSRAIAAATAAAKTGCKVFLVTYMSYPGDDICGSFLYDTKEGETKQTALSMKLFPGKQLPTPLHVKTVLEDELLQNNVDFLYSSYVTNVVTDSDGYISGVVIANRSGRQVIKCKAVIDATHTATVAELAGAAFLYTKENAIDVQFSVVGNGLKEDSAIKKAETLDQSFTVNGKKYPVIRYTFSFPLKDDDYASLMEAEQIARTKTWDPDQVDSSDLLWYMPGKKIKAIKEYTGNEFSIRGVPQEAFQPEQLKNLWVLGPCAGINDALREKYMRPVNAIVLGGLLGETVGEKAKKIAQPVNLRVPASRKKGEPYGSVKEILQPLRPGLQTEYVPYPESALPVLGQYDVVVLGGGTAGAPAGISAARNGARTLMLEYLHGLGGLSTVGLIGRYWDGFREGFTVEIDEGVKNMGPEDHPRQLKKWKEDSQSDWKSEWLRKEFLKAGGKLWYGVLGSGALVKDNKIEGVVVSTPFGRGIVLCKILIDSTGSADIAIAAGAKFDYTGKKTIAIQGAGLGKMDPGDHYINNDWTFIDDTDILDVSRVYVQAKPKFTGRYDIVKLPQTRERRRVVGEHVISVYDVLNHRRYSDTISYHNSSFDTHGMITDPYFMLSPPMERHQIYEADVPLRSLLPAGLEGILVTGLGASAHRDAMPVIRMQPCLQSQGYAVGYLSAMCVKEKKTIRQIDIRKIQKHLVEMGNLPERVLKDKDFKGFDNKTMQKAALTVTDNYKGLEILLTDPERTVELISKEMVKTTDREQRVIYASILCMLGKPEYASVLTEKIKSYDGWDKGWHYKGMGQFGMSMSRLDALITALGNTKESSGLSAVIEKARMLYPESEFSHFRAIAMAAEAINSKEALPVLTKLLTTPGVRFNSINSYAEARAANVPNDVDVSRRNRALKELHLARALYLCGDAGNLGKDILERYAQGLEGHYARYAHEVLSSK
jgi:flavin-dependent dehydrogenase